jgi:sporulation integral membrane protein YlbJ
MLPFLIIIEIMSGLGVMHFVGGLLDPVMRRLFRMPGIAGWCLAVGWTAGSPAAARQIAELREDGVFTRRQAEQLMGLAHAGSPVLIVIVVAAGFLSQPELGLPLLIIHWLGAIAAAIALRERDDTPASELAHALPAHSASHRGGLLASSLRAMEQARASDGRPIGRLLGESVFESIQKLLVIGGYMIFFSVLIKIILLFGAGQVIVQALSDALDAVGVPSAIAVASFHGLFEQHLGTYALHGTAADKWTIAALSGLLGWSGWCLHAQVKAAAAGTDLRYRSFLLCRLMHAIAGVVLSLLVYPLLGVLPSGAPGFRLTGEALPVWSDGLPHPVSYPDWASILQLDALLLAISAAVLALLAMISAVIMTWSRQKR